MTDYQDKRVLVTGGHGFIGRPLCIRLASMGAEVVAVDSSAELEAMVTSRRDYQVMLIDALNPQLAARIARVMDRWNHLAEPYRSAARRAIARVAAKPELSSGVREVIERALTAA